MFEKRERDYAIACASNAHVPIVSTTGSAASPFRFRTSEFVAKFAYSSRLGQTMLEVIDRSHLPSLPSNLIQVCYTFFNFLFMTRYRVCTTVSACTFQSANNVKHTAKLIYFREVVEILKTSIENAFDASKHRTSKMEDLQKGDFEK